MIGIRDITKDDRRRFSLETQAVGGPCVVSDSDLVDLTEHPTRIAWRGATPVG